jgi:archaellum biogenesis ATPase FlaH
MPLRISLPFLPSEEERKKRDLDLRNKKVSFKSLMDKIKNKTDNLIIIDSID